MASAFGKILLLTGNAEFLAYRTRSRAIAAILAEEPECEISESDAGGLGPGELANLTSPSLFSPATVVVLSELQDLPDVAQSELVAYASAPMPEVALILMHGGGQKGKGLLDKLRKMPNVSEVKLDAPKYERDYAKWVHGELRELGSRVDEETATFMVAAVGQDLRALAGAADQLVASVEPGGPITIEIVRRYFGGRAEVKGYEIADAAIEGRLSVALEKARWGEASKLAPVLVISAVAGALRSLVKLAAAPQGLSENELAKHVGAPPFKIRSMRRQLRGWDPRSLAKALDAVAQADLDVKGGAADPSFAIERMVLQVAAARSSPTR